jgi:hypothetical protein
MEDNEVIYQPDLTDLIEEMREVYQFFRECDATHSFEAVCALDMAIYILEKLNNDDDSDVCSSIAYNMRWLAGYTLDCDEGTMDKDSRAVMEAVVCARGHALGEAIMKERFASVGMTTTSH